MVRLLFTVQKENQPGRLLDPLDKFQGKGTRYKLGCKGFASQIRDVESGAGSTGWMQNQKLVRWRGNLAAGMIEFLASEPLCSERLKICPISCMIGMHEPIGIGLFVKNDIKPDQKVGLSGAI